MVALSGTFWVFLGFLIFLHIYLRTCRALRSRSLPPMPRRLIHDTGYWERGGATAFGKVAAASRLWLADVIVSIQTGPAGRKPGRPCPGNRTVAVNMSRRHSDGRERQLGSRGQKGSKPLILSRALCPLVNPSPSGVALQVHWNHYPHRLVTDGA